jgi:hypothetical protein
MEVSDQFHAPTAYPLEIEPPVPIGWEAGWASMSVWTLGTRVGNQTSWSVAVPTDVSIHYLKTLYQMNLVLDEKVIMKY